MSQLGFAGAAEPHFDGELTDGKTAAVRPAVLTLEASRLVIRAGGAETEGAGPWAIWPLAGLVVEDLQAGGLRVGHPSLPGGAVVCRDPGLALALRARGVGTVGSPGGGRLARLAAIYGGALALVVAGAYAAVPPLSRLLARRVPIALEDRLAFEVERLFAADVCHSEAGDAALAALTDRLAGAGQTAALDGPRPRRVTIINWELVNAFTLPGGKVLLTRGLLDEAQAPDEVAGVLAHELEHVRQRHIMAHLIRGSILSFGWAATVGDLSGLFVIDPSTAFSLANQRFSRGDERAADAGALERLDGAGISRQGFAAFFRRVAKQTDVVPAWMTSHPATEERLSAIERDPARPASAPVTAALTPAQWLALKTVCGQRPPVRDPLRGLLRKAEKPKS